MGLAASVEGRFPEVEVPQAGGWTGLLRRRLITFSLGFLVVYVDQATSLGIFLQGLGAGLLGLLVAIIILTLFKNRELGEFIRALSARVWREPIRVEEEEI